MEDKNILMEWFLTYGWALIIVVMILAVVVLFPRGIEYPSSENEKPTPIGVSIITGKPIIAFEERNVNIYVPEGCGLRLGSDSELEKGEMYIEALICE